MCETSLICHSRLSGILLIPLFGKDYIHFPSLEMGGRGDLRGQSGYSKKDEELDLLEKLQHIGQK